MSLKQKSEPKIFLIPAPRHLNFVYTFVYFLLPLWQFIIKTAHFLHFYLVMLPCQDPPDLMERHVLVNLQHSSHDAKCFPCTLQVYFHSSPIRQVLFPPLLMKKKFCLKSSILTGFSFKNHGASEVYSNLEARRKLKIAWPDFRDEHGEND